MSESRVELLTAQYNKLWNPADWAHLVRTGRYPDSEWGRVARELETALAERKEGGN